MRFFDNSSINRVYMHTALQSFAFNSGGAFIYVYLLKAGIPVALIFVILAVVILARIVIRQSLVPLLKRIGLRNGLILGSTIDASSFLFLAHVDGLGMWLLAYVVLASCGTAFYWTCYHACITRLGDPEHRGAQVSAREAIFALTGIVGPLFGGLALTVLGPVYAFAITAMINGLAIVPLLGVPYLKILPEAELAAATKFFARAITISDGIVAASTNFGWRIVLFQTLGESFNAYGGTMAIASLGGAIMGLGVGRLIDLGHHKRSVQIGITAMSCTILAQAFGHATVWSALAATMVGAVAGPLYISSIMAPYYNMGKSSACSIRYNVVGENGFDTGAGFSCLAAAALVWAGFGSFWLLILGLVGCFSCYLVLQRKTEIPLVAVV